MASPTPGSEGRNRWEGWHLSRDDGSGRKYRRPATGVRIQPGFFLQGWHLVLTPSEIACYFALVELSQRFSYAHSKNGVGLAPSERILRYGMSDETYSKHNELAEFGLIQRMPDSVPYRRGGKVSAAVRSSPIYVYPFQVELIDSQQSAINVVIEKLDNPTPPRIFEFDPFASIIPG